MSKTPWRIDGKYIKDADGNLIIFSGDWPTGIDELVVAAMNFYESLSEDVRKLSPSTVAKCLEILGKSLVDAVDAKIDALEAEEAGRG